MAPARILRGQHVPGIRPAWEPTPCPEAIPTLHPPAPTAEQAQNVLEEKLRQMESRLTLVEKEAYQRGLTEGEAKARALEERLAALHQKLAETIIQLGSYKAGLRAAAEKDLVELALAVARRVLHREVNVDPHALEGIIGAALERVSAQEVVAVKTHPFHAEALRGALARLAPGNRISVHGDPALPVGSLILEMPRGNLDASVDSQLEEIERGLADRLGRIA